MYILYVKSSESHKNSIACLTQFWSGERHRECILGKLTNKVKFLISRYTLLILI